MVDVSKLTKKRLGELLKEEGVIGEPEIQEALDRQEETDELLGRALIELGHVTEQDIARAVCTQFGLPYVDASNYMPNNELVDEIPESFIREYCFLPLDRIGDVAVVAVSGVLQEDFFNKLEEYIGTNIQLVISTRKDIENALVSGLGMNPANVDAEEAEEHMEREPDHEEEEEAVPSSEEPEGEPEPVSAGGSEESEEEEKVFSLEETEDGEPKVFDLESEAEKMEESDEKAEVS